MNSGPNGDQMPAERPGSVEPVEPMEAVLVEGSGRKVRDQRIGLVFAGLAVAALLVGGLIALVLAMAG